MDRLKRLKREIRQHQFLLIVLSNLLLLIAWRTLSHLAESNTVILTALASLAVVLALVLSSLSSEYLIQPVQALWQAILHVSPHKSHVAAPNLDAIKLGRELVTSLSLEVYQMASPMGTDAPDAPSDPALQILIDNNPLPFIAINHEQSITFVGKSASTYFDLKPEELVGKNFYSLFDLAFASQDTLDSWYLEVQQSSVTSSRNWEQVRLKLPDKDPLLFDLSARYTQNPTGSELFLAFFDHTETYQQNEQAVGFVALAAHELRAPITLLRGYIDVFDEELGASLTPELKDFMIKMQVASQRLTVFVNNILNVARVEEGSLSMKLQEQSWDELIRQVLADWTLPLQIHNKTVIYTPSANLPSVAIDRLSMYEVLSNVIDNAIKYSGPKPKKILITTALNNDGDIETHVTDEGVGIPANIVPHLFEKFYRNHRTKSGVGGTGLGLYLCKAIISAHGGNIWVSSHEGGGTTIGFTVQTLEKAKQKLPEGETAPQNDGIVRVAHGWIKNHSMYRR